MQLIGNISIKRPISAIALAHPAPTPFVQQVGRALFEAGLLSQFATTLVNRPDAVWLNALNSLSALVKFDLAKQLSRRSVTEFPLSQVRDNPLPEVIRILVGRVDKDQRLTDVVFHWGTGAYDRWVARQVLADAQVVYGYEYACLATFQAAKKQGIACIYDVPSPEHDFVENLLHEELKVFPELNTPYRRYVRDRQTQRTQHRRQEWQLADVVIANSEFTKASYAGAGLDVEKVRVVPYGAPPVCTEGFQGGSSEREPCRFLWAGTFSIRKGAHYLLQAWKQLQPHSSARLNVYGAMGLPASLLKDVPDSVQVSGTVPRSELYKLYHQADVLVFPTLCDGFGMVVTEAFAQGLPVITTDRAGAADLVRHGDNGLIIPAGDADALADALVWCLSHRQELKAMRQAALETAAKWQWSDYRQALIENLLDGLKAAGYCL
ncbi:glycosyltransferase family 4 protein [Kovacikia minuta CCNUW1]|uniref:glycosyltransferase family 4 protein n=1 Tax=Kovacikia minuta TaxID=2931930 RepID=UPI001CCF718B|nr:glycosyltransferase family 4 protein [Kovacikia minuta]UBF28984.1 glycosyltransferase family 4 protein [Kovacikia minuta CCNUW1]